MRRAGRDGHVSYRGQIYQVPLAYALSEIAVSESLAGEITLRTKAGAVLRPTVGMPTVGRAAFRPGHGDARRAESPASPPHLHLIAGDGPVVETRDLAVYEEVARAVGRG